jgi:multiple sugar transport system permease protein
VRVLWTWNDLLVTLVISTRTDTQMLPLGLTKFVLEYGVDWGSMIAAGVIMFIPTLLFDFIAQRYLIKGLTLGGVKEQTCAPSKPHRPWGRRVGACR